jgi:hypothetical protein
MQAFPHTLNGRATPGVKAGDIKGNLMSDDQVADIPTDLVYMWVRTGEWKKRDFERWLKVLRVIE